MSSPNDILENAVIKDMCKESDYWWYIGYRAKTYEQLATEAHGKLYYYEGSPKYLTADIIIYKLQYDCHYYGRTFPPDVRGLEYLGETELCNPDEDPWPLKEDLPEGEWQEFEYQVLRRLVEETSNQIDKYSIIATGMNEVARTREWPIGTMNRGRYRKRMIINLCTALHI